MRFNYHSIKLKKHVIIKVMFNFLCRIIFLKHLHNNNEIEYLYSICESITFW